MSGEYKTLLVWCVRVSVRARACVRACVRVGSLYRVLFVLPKTLFDCTAQIKELPTCGHVWCQYCENVK